MKKPIIFLLYISTLTVNTNAEPLNSTVAGHGCVINTTALATYNQNPTYLTTQVDASRLGIREKVIPVTYDIGIPPECDINATLDISNYEQLQKPGNIQVDDIHFISGSQKQHIGAGTSNILQIVLMYTVTQPVDEEMASLSLKLDKKISF